MPGSSKNYWDDAARDNAAWHIATRHQTESTAFFESGGYEVDEYLRLAGVTLDTTSTVLEIGCGVGRMTRRLAELAGNVIASDVSPEMLARAQHNLNDLHNIRYREVAGNGDLDLADETVTAVFSYITMQHVPTATAQERYFAESLRVLAPGGWALIQYRRNGPLPRLLDWAGHLTHLARGRKTLHRAWRGSRIPETTLRSHASANINIDILQHNRRHVWALAHKT